VRKEASEFEGAFDINFRPPLLLKNCLPLGIRIQYKDTNRDTDSVSL
jgi:hypothetical protein